MVLLDPGLDFIGFLRRDRLEEFEYSEQLILDLFFLGIGPLRAILIVGAVVIDVAAFLDLRRYRASAFAAFQHLTELEHPAGAVRGHPSAAYILDPIEDLLTDKRWMGCLDLVCFAIPSDRPVVEGILEHALYLALCEEVSIRVSQALLVHEFPECLHRVVSACIHLEHLSDDRSGLFVEDMDLVALFPDSHVSDRCAARITALADLLGLALLHLLREIVRVEAGDCNFHIPYEVLMRFRVLVENEVFLHEVNLPAILLMYPVINHGCVFHRSRKTVDLFHEDDSYGTLAHVLEHFVQSFSYLPLACRFRDTINLCYLIALL